MLVLISVACKTFLGRITYVARVLFWDGKAARGEAGIEMLLLPVITGGPSKWQNWLHTDQTIKGN